MQRGGSNRDFVCVSNPPVPSARNRRCCPWTTLGKLSKEQPPPLFTLWRRQSLRETAFQPIALLLLPPAAVVVVAGQPLCVPDDKELRATVVNTTGFLRISVETKKNAAETLVWDLSPISVRLCCVRPPPAESLLPIIQIE